MIYRLSKLPPSANRMYGLNKGRGIGRFISKDYAAWIVLATRDISPVKPLQAFYYTLTARVPVKMKRKNSDLDNFLKPLSDLMVRTGATPDDCQCRDFRIHLADVPTIEIEVIGL